MSRRNWVLAFVASLLLAGPVLADNEFNTGSEIRIDPTGTSGWVWQGAWGENAVVTDISSFLAYTLFPDTGRASIQTDVFFTGFWGDPLADNPYYDVLEDGLRQHQSYRMTEVLQDGDWYRFQDRVDFELDVLGSLFRDQDSGQMFGDLSANINGENAIPRNTWLGVQIYEPGHPDSFPDWRLTLSSTWEVTTPFGLVPEPSSLALLILGSLAGLRRRAA